MVSESESVWKLAPLRAQVLVQLQIVVDLAVGRQGQVSVGGDHGLVPGGEPDDGQPGLGQPDRTRAVDAAVVRSAVGEAGGHETPTRRGPGGRPLRSTKPAMPHMGPLGTAWRSTGTWLDLARVGAGRTGPDLDLLCAPPGGSDKGGRNTPRLGEESQGDLGHDGIATGR